MTHPNDSGARAHEVVQQRSRNTQRWTAGNPSGDRIVRHPAAFLMLQFLKTSARHLPAFRAHISATE